MIEKVKSLFIGGLVSYRALKSFILSSQQKVEAEKHEAGAGSEQGQPEEFEQSAAPIVPDGPDKDAPATEQGAAKGDAEAQGRQNRWSTDERWMTVFTGIIVFVTSVNAAFAIIQVISVKRIFNIVERPYVSVKEVRITDVAPGQSPTAEIFLENSGRTPALNATFMVYIDLTEGFIRNAPEKLPPFANVPGNVFIPAGTTVRVRATAVNARLMIDGDTLDEIVKHKKYLSIFGEGRYEDASKNLLRFKFCFFYDPTYPSEPQPCPNHNSYE